VTTCSHADHACPIVQLRHACRHPLRGSQVGG
jgi:hypothetical protein